MFKTGLKRRLALMLTVALLLGGCAQESASTPSGADLSLPEPDVQSARSIMGEQRESSAFDVVLHCVSENALSLSTMTRTLEISQNENLIERTLNVLIDSAALSGTADVEIERLEIGSGVASVCLNPGADANRSDQDYLLLCASIAATLLEFENIDAVNILSGDCSAPVSGLPLGAFVDVQDNLAALYAQIQSEADRFPDAGGSISRNVLLYFPSQDGQYMLPEVRELTFESDHFASVLLRALSDGPLMHTCSDSALPGSQDFLLEAPSEMRTEAGERIIELHFSASLLNYLEFTGMQPWQLYASIVLSLCSFMPELDAVRFYIEQDRVEECVFNGRICSFQDGLMRRSDFESAIGSSAGLYFASESGGLVRDEVSMARSASISPLALLHALISAQPRADLNAQSVFPEGITPNDILGVSVAGRTATVNLSSCFYALCQSLSAQQERQLIYAIINTLTELNEISAVAFLVEGNSIQYLAQDIYLGTALLADQGLVENAPANLSGNE